LSLQSKWGQPFSLVIFPPSSSFYSATTPP
jgi:hypothetical protein